MFLKANVTKKTKHSVSQNQIRVAAGRNEHTITQGKTITINNKGLPFVHQHTLSNALKLSLGVRNAVYEQLLRNHA